ncbi:hypothetical protein [Clostridium intestinale]|uniref:Uncharacterized protein n=1 Tax=Clostridium intestinale URNW TaxID=1294142 RepID=U2PYK7_9CLOT|nr:hypothetical protein [Clostridium intestinale]ERK31555.1 hypothetical protein CINTURNW_1053 [Clostridium intestinale URNW]
MTLNIQNDMDGNISNIPNKAEEYYTRFKTADNIIRGLAQPSIMMESVSQMELEINNLLEMGYISNGDIKHSMLKTNIEDMCNIISSVDKDLNGMEHFYYTYNNFRDVCKSIRGDSNV